MAQLQKSVVTLRIYSDDLVPQQITELLGVSPTHAKSKGEKTVGSKTGKEYIAKSGIWRICASDREPGDLDGQIREILSQVTADRSVWQSITTKYRVNLFCGLFMNETNDGVAISPQSLAALGERGIELWFDIYAPLDDEHETST